MLRRSSSRHQPNIVGLDNASGLAEKPLDCLRRMRALFESGSLPHEKEPDLAKLDQAYTLLLRCPVQGLKALKTLADHGSLMSELYIAEAHRTGVSGRIDITKSANWYRRAFNEGSVFASYRLGRIYLKTGQYFYAKECFEYGVSMDFTPAVFLMGYMYVYGLGVQKNWNTARDFLERASTEGHVLAKGILASLLIRRQWGLFQVLRGLVLACAAFKDVVTTEASSIRRM